MSKQRHNHSREARLHSKYLAEVARREAWVVARLAKREAFLKAEALAGLTLPKQPLVFPLRRVPSWAEFLSPDSTLINRAR